MVDCELEHAPSLHTKRRPAEIEGGGRNGVGLFDPERRAVLMESCQTFAVKTQCQPLMQLPWRLILSKAECPAHGGGVPVGTCTLSRYLNVVRQA